MYRTRTSRIVFPPELQLESDSLQRTTKLVRFPMTREAKFRVVYLNLEHHYQSQSIE